MKFSTDIDPETARAQMDLFELNWDILISYFSFQYITGAVQHNE